jgi:hypothetical protein
VTAAPDALAVFESAPHVAPLQPVPESVQLTPLLEPSLVTVAVKICPWPTCTDCAIGDTLTMIAAGVGAGSGAGLLELEVTPEQPHSNISVTKVTPKKDCAARSAKVRFTVDISPKNSITGFANPKSFWGVEAALFYV